MVSHDTMTFRGLPNGGTEVTYEAIVRLKGVLKILDPVVGAPFRRSSDKAPDGLDAKLAA